MADLFDYNEARETALELIEFFGQPGTVVKKGTTGGQDAWGDPKPDEPDVTINGIITPLLQYKTKEIDDTNIKRGDSFVFFHSDTSPEINMQTTINGKTFRIVDTIVLNSVDDINIFRKLQLRV